MKLVDRLESLMRKGTLIGWHPKRNCFVPIDSAGDSLWWWDDPEGCDDVSLEKCVDKTLAKVQGDADGGG